MHGSLLHAIVKAHFAPVFPVSIQTDNFAPPPPKRMVSAAPASPTALFLAFTRLAMQGFGGVLPVAQRELVDRLGWLSRAEFLEVLAVAQVLPGPNIVNMALMIGDRFHGWRGAAAALGGLMCAPLLIVLLLANASYFAWSQGHLRPWGWAPQEQAEPQRDGQPQDPPAALGVQLLQNPDAWV